MTNKLLKEQRIKSIGAKSNHAHKSPQSRDSLSLFLLGDASTDVAIESETARAFLPSSIVEDATPIQVEENSLFMPI